jgi:glycosyltransferase involved in cell wall biosynthesis
MFQNGLNLVSNILQNILNNQSQAQLTYIVEPADWSIQEDGKAITHALREQKLLRARISTTPFGLRNQIVHFGSVNTFFTKQKWHKLHHSNRTILTWFHVVPDDARLERMRSAQQELHRIHTSCQITKNSLVKAGIDKEKIVVIPLGVDTHLFSPTIDEQKQEARKKLGIPQDRLVIGSFQKDGVGWGEGLEPKLIKGPDIFVETLVRLKHLNPFVLLTGPARGYVKRRLEKNGIEYKHVYLKNFQQLPTMYRALNLYLITSRIEGGPKALLESWASEVPVVSTRVGMIPDIAVDGETVLLAEIKQTENLAHQAEKLATRSDLHEQLITNALREVQPYHWNAIARQYFEKLYRPIL